MKKYLMLTMIATITISILSSCKKDGDNTTVKTKTQLLTEKTWKQVKIEQKVNPADSWTDVTGSYSACDLDNIITFLLAGTFTETEGATKCVSTDPDLASSGNWSFQSSETILRLISSGMTNDATIETLDGSTLKFSFSNASVPIYLKITMQH